MIEIDGFLVFRMLFVKCLAIVFATYLILWPTGSGKWFSFLKGSV